MNLQWCPMNSSTPSLPDSPTLPVSIGSLNNQLFMGITAISGNFPLFIKVGDQSILYARTSTGMLVPSCCAATEDRHNISS